MTPDALFHQAVATHRQGRFAAAAALYRELLALQPGHGGALVNLGLLALQQGDLPSAERQFRALTAAAPEQPEPWRYLGSALNAAGRPAEALAAFDRALALRPDDGDALNNKGNALKALGRLDAALDIYAQLLRRHPDHAEGYANLGGLLKDLGQPEQALLACRQALTLAPGLPSARHNLGSALMALGRVDEAIALFRATLADHPDFAAVRADLALAQLLTGDLEAGWIGYETRWRLPGCPWRTDIAAPLWQGQPLAGRRLLVWAEQGLGDAIQFSRYLPRLAAQGAELLFQLPAPLLPLFAAFPGIAALLPAGAALPAVDFHVPLLSLPGRLGTRLDSIPPVVAPPVDARRSAAWQQRLAAFPRPRIGLVWAGNPAHLNDRARSLPLASLRQAVERTTGTRFSLQLGPPAGQLAALPDGWAEDLAPGLPDFAETAAALGHLDLCIAVDTAVAHLSASLGRPTWLCLPFAPDWRWLRERGDSPWYPSLRLFRQPRPGDWDSVMRAVAAALDEPPAVMLTPEPLRTAARRRSP